MARRNTQAPPPSDVPPDAGILIGTSQNMCAVRRRLQQYAEFPCPVRLEGERGTGKNLAAQWLHQASRRRGPFVRHSLAVLSAEEGREAAGLFGWRRGAFTGAVSDNPGAFERAQGGTLFLNEIGLASPRVQELLLHALEEKSVRRAGECVGRLVDVRIVFGTNVDLVKAVRAGTFRADLYDRLGLIDVVMPPLRMRLEDIPELSATFLVRTTAALGRPAPVLRPAELDRLMSHTWPGNVRELENHLWRFIVDGELPVELRRAHRPVSAWRAAVESSIRQAGGNKAAAARALGISRKALYEHLHRSRTNGRPDTDV